MRIVLDTNVLVSAALKADSVPSRAVQAVLRNGILLKSDATERQLFEVLNRPYFSALIAPAVTAQFRIIFGDAERVVISERITVCRDPTDDKFLELAINGHAHMIVSGDTDLLVLHPFRGIPIVPPAAFLREVARTASPP